MKFNKKAQSMVPILISIMLIIAVFSVGFMTENKVTGMVTGVEGVEGLVKVTGTAFVTEDGVEYSMEDLYWTFMEEDRDTLIEMARKEFGESPTSPSYVSSWTQQDEDLLEKLTKEHEQLFVDGKNQNDQEVIEKREEIRKLLAKRDAYEKAQIFTEEDQGNLDKLIDERLQLLKEGSDLDSPEVKEKDRRIAELSAKKSDYEQIQKATVQRDYVNEFKLAGERLVEANKQLKEVEDSIEWWRFGIFLSDEQEEKKEEAKKAIETARKEVETARQNLLENDPEGALKQSLLSKRITKSTYDDIMKELGEIEEKGEKEGRTETEIKTEKEEYASKELAKMESMTKITQNKAYELTSQLLNMLLGEYAQEMVADLCKEEWDSSEPASNKPYNSNPGPNNPLTMNSSQLSQSAACGSSDKTTMSAQGTRSGGSPYTYDISWSITACKQNIQYTVYLANTKNDKEAVEFGTVNKGKTGAGTKQFQNSKSYIDACIQVSDTSVGDNGFACFSLVI